MALALTASVVPTPAHAKWQDMSGSLPGFASTGAVVGGGVAAAALVGVVIYYKMHHTDHTRVKIDPPRVMLDGIATGQAIEKTVPVTNKMSVSITVKDLGLEDPSNAITLAGGRQVPFTIAPNETVEIPVKVNAANREGNARLRVVASAPTLKKDATEYVKISYGHEPSKLGKMLHRQ
jgi:hypothetical protein